MKLFFSILMSSLLLVGSKTLADSADMPSLNLVGNPQATSLYSQEITVTPKCELTKVDEGYKDPVLVDYVCCKQSGPIAMRELLAKAIHGTVLRTLPGDARSEEIYSHGCTKNLSTTQIVLRFNVTYLPY